MGYAFAILAIATAVFLPFPRTIPHPEDISPHVYALAFLFAVFALLLKAKRPSFWLYLPFPLISLFLLLEEISYGVELNWVSPIYVPQLETKIYDVHNLLPEVFRALRRQLGWRNWSTELFAQYVLVDLFILALIALFIYRLRRQSAKPGSAKIRQYLLGQFFFFSSPLPFLAVAWLLWLPKDPRNALLLSLSPVRLAMIIGLVLAGIAFLFLAAKTQKKEHLKALTSSLEKRLTPRSVQLMEWGLLAFLFAVLLFQLLIPGHSYPEKTVLLNRLNPLIAWITAQAALLLLFARTWQRRFPHPAAPAPRLPDVQGFLQRHPAYIYLGVALAQVLFAQFLDRGLISINEVIHWPAFWVENWNLVIEELLELTGAFELLAAAFFVTSPNDE